MEKNPDIELTVLNPRNYIESGQAFGLSPRVAELEGRKIALYWNGKPDGDYFWDTIEHLFREKFPTSEILRYNGPGDIGESMADRISGEPDAVMYGVGD